MVEIPREDRIQAIDVFTRSRYPREFARRELKQKRDRKTGDLIIKKKFYRNTIVRDPERILWLSEKNDFKDCYISNFSFTEIDENGVWIRETAVIDGIIFDLDNENDLFSSFLEARKLVKFFLSHGITPYVQFSGKKGFHVRVYCDPVPLKNPRETLSRLCDKITSSLSLKNVDRGISSDIARVVKHPFSIHGETGRLCIPLNPDWLIKFDVNSILHFSKEGRYHFPEIEESEQLKDWFELEDLKIGAKLDHQKFKSLKLRLTGFRARKKGNWREKFIQRYLEVLQKHGRLTRDLEIAERHEGCERKARHWLACLMFEVGYPENEIKRVFTFAEDYRPEKTEYFVEYARGWLKNRGEVIEK